MARVRPWLLAALALLACAREPDRSTGLGRRVAAGPARNLSPSPDGDRLAFLDRCARPPGAMAPPGIAICDLVVVPSEGGSPARVAEGVPSLPAALPWSPDGRSLAALAEYEFTTGRGALVRVGPDGQRTRVAASVGFHVYAEDVLVLLAGYAERDRLAGELAEARGVLAKAAFVDGRPLEEVRAFLARTEGASSNGSPARVGCERDDGLLNIHAEDETCEVCRPSASESGRRDE